MRRQPGVVDAPHLRVVREPLRHRHPVGRMALHAHGQCLRAAQDEPAVERTGNAARRVLDELQAFVQLGRAADDRSTDHVGVATEVLRRRVRHQVRAEQQRLL